VPAHADLIARLPEMFWELDEPTADFAALLTRIIAAEARRNGIKVLLMGTGGGGIFFGCWMDIDGKIMNFFGKVPQSRAFASMLVRRLPWNSLLGRRLSRLGALLSLDEEEMLIESMSESTWPQESRLALLALEAQSDLKGAQGILRDVLMRTKG